MSGIAQRTADVAKKLLCDPQRLEEIQSALDAKVKAQINDHKELSSPSRQVAPVKLEHGSIPVTDALIPELPTGTEKGEHFVLALTAREVCASLVNYSGDRKISATSVSKDMWAKHDDLEYPLADSRTPCSALVQQACKVVKQLLEERDLSKATTTMPVALCVGFPIEQHRRDSAVLLTWTHGVATARDTPEDPVEGTDLCVLLNTSFRRLKIPAHIVAATTETTALLLAGSYQKERYAPKCIVAVAAGSGIQTAHSHLHAETYGFQGCVMNAECGLFEGTSWGPPHKYAYEVILPVCTVDGEAEALVNDRRISGRITMNHMITARYIPETIRLLSLKALQKHAPANAWVEGSLPMDACWEILRNASDEDEISDVLRKCWGKEMSEEEVQSVKKIAVAVFSRAAALTAVTTSVVAKGTGRLQPALGGVSVAVSGQLMEEESFRSLVRRYLNIICETETEKIIRFSIVPDGAIKGTGLLLAQ